MKKKPSSANDSDLSKLGDRIRSARHKSSISQSELARRIGVSAIAVAQWETPLGTQPSIPSLVRILEITGVSLDWLLMGRGARRALTIEGETEKPAVALDFFAHCVQEENLLINFRKIPTKSRTLLLDLAEERSAARTSNSR